MIVAKSLSPNLKSAWVQMAERPAADHLRQARRWEEYAAAHPHSAPARHAVGRMLVRAHLEARALPWFEQALRLDPTHQDARSEVARLHRQERR